MTKSEIGILIALLALLTGMFNLLSDSQNRDLASDYNYIL